MAIKLTSYYSPTDSRRMGIAAEFDNALFDIAQLLEIEVVKQIAARYVEENYAQIVAKLDQVAIANLAIAAAGQAVAKEIGEHPIMASNHSYKTYNNKQSIF